MTMETAHETVEKGQCWPFGKKGTLENKEVMGSNFFGFRVLRPSQQPPVADALQRPLVLRSRFRVRLTAGVGVRPLTA
jgi:hypothetical protein